MIRYLLWHSLMSLLVLASVYAGRSAPPRINMFVAFFGMLLWLIPFPLFHIPVSDAVAESAPATMYHFLVVGEGGTATATPEVTSHRDAAPTLNLESLLFQALVLATLFGFPLFLRDLFQQRRTIAALRKNARRLRSPLTRTKVAVFQMPGSGAMTTGIFHPRVWIGADHIRQPEFRALLAHELTHVRRADNAYLLAARLLERLLWWNPLVLALSERMRFYLELSCDQSCCSRFEKQAYREALAATMLKVAGLTPPRNLLAVAWGTGERHNLTRIKMIDGSFQMRKGYISSLVVLVLANAVLLAAPGRMMWHTAATTSTTLATAGPEKQHIGEIARVGQPGVEAPVFTNKVAPNYPKDATEAKIEGYVILEALLRKTGTIEDIKVLRTIAQGRYQFEEEAQAALTQWEFLPATRDGEAIDVRMTLKIDFLLDGKKKVRQIAITKWRNLNPGMEGKVRIPRIINNDTASLKKAADQTQIQIPVLVEVAAGGELLDVVLNDQALASFGNPQDIRNRVDSFLDHLTFEPAEIGETPVDTEIRFHVPLNL